MQYRTFKKTGEKISLLGFGAMRFPQKSDGSVDEKESIDMIRAAIQGGVNYVDTAYMYHGGVSEAIVGKALKGGYRDKVFLADKLPLWSAGDEAGQQKIFDEQLSRLDVDMIDMYLLHSLSGPIWKLAKKFNSLGFLERKKAEGRIKHIGFSFHDNISIFKEIIDAYPWDFCQIQLNYMDTEWQAGVEGLKYAAEKGIPVIVMEPLKGGLLTDGLPERVKKILDEADVKRSLAEWALRWVANFPEVLTILSGMSNMAQLEENIKILSAARPGGMPKEELDLIERVADTYNALIQYPCTSCGYCLPCKKKIYIPDMMNYYNELFVFGQRQKTKASYRGNVPEGRGAKDCIDCKECEERCPQRLDISGMMKKASEIFDK